MADRTSSDTETVEGPPRMNILERLHACRCELGKLEKDGKIEMRGGASYEYISHDLVTATVRIPLNKYKVMVIPTIHESKTDGNRCEVVVDVTFACIDNPTDGIRIRTIGYGVDSSDKGPGKAYSYAMKIAYLKLFMLNTGDDIEEHDTPHDPEKARGSQIDAAKQETRDAIETAAKNLKAAIDGATTIKELNATQRENKDWLMTVPEVTRDYFVEQIESRKATIKESE